MGLFDSTIRVEVDRQLADKLSVIIERLRALENRVAEATSANSANHHSLGLMQGALSTLDRKVTDIREQMQSDEDYTRKLALRVIQIENTDGGVMPDADGG